MKRNNPAMKGEENRESEAKIIKLTADTNNTKEQEGVSTSVSAGDANGTSGQKDFPGTSGTSCSEDAAATYKTPLQVPSAGAGDRIAGDADNNQVLIVELNNTSVCMRDKRRVETIIRKMQRAGPNTLQVISDFDMTLTRFAHNGKRCPTTHNILHSGNLISERCKEKMSELLDRYYPIEIDSSMSVEDKIPHMEEWWKRAHELLIKEQITKDTMSEAVRVSGAMLREGYKSFFDLLQQTSVPLLIFSAGVGDILEEVISEHHVFHPNVRVFSNYMEYNQQGVATAFKDPLIHTFNKREGALEKADQFVHDRSNVLLLGDSLGDLSMADGVKGLENVLRIGYLNDKVEERKEAYVRSYDVVLLTDETLDVPNAILKHITGTEEPSVPDTGHRH